MNRRAFIIGTVATAASAALPPLPLPAEPASYVSLAEAMDYAARPNLWAYMMCEEGVLWGVPAVAEPSRDSSLVIRFNPPTGTFKRITIRDDDGNELLHWNGNITTCNGCDAKLEVGLDS